MLIAEKFIKSLVEKYGRHIVYIDGDTCTHKPVLFLNLKHRLHSNLEKSLIERVIQYFKDKTESLDDYYPCTNKKNCDLLHVYNWIKLFIYLYNTTFRNKIPFLVNEGELVLN